MPKNAEHAELAGSSPPLAPLPTRRAPATLGALADWILRTRPLREAQARLAAQGGSHEKPRRQLVLLLEAARRLADPVEALPAGSQPALLLPLYRDAIYWALVSMRPPVDQSEVPDLATVWADASPQTLLEAAHDPVTLAAVKEAIFERATTGSLKATPQDAMRVRAFATALYARSSSPARQVERLLLQRWVRIGALALGLLAIGVGFRRLALGPNLVAGKPFQTSSKYAACAGALECEGLMFHTDNENNPWVEFDLGAPKSIHRIEVKNRPEECCLSRAVPLIAEASVDRVRWTEVGKRTEKFSDWVATFPTQSARYVRLRVPRVSILHLKDVKVR